MIYIQSKNVSYYSRIMNFGVSIDESKNLYYCAKSEIRIEKIEE